MKNKIDKSKLLFDNKYLVALTLPLIIEVFLSVSVGMIDTMMVSQAGEDAVSGVSVINNIQNLLVFLLSAFGTGGAVVASQLIGKGERDKACFSAKQLMNISIVFSVVIAAVFLIVKRPAVKLIFGTLEPDVFESAIDYFVPILLSMPFLAVQTAGNALLRSMGKSKITMYASIAVNLVNVVGNAAFLFIFDLGSLGVGLATMLSRVIGSVIIFIVLLDKKALLYIDSPLKIEFDMKLIALILKIALPSGVENCIFHVGKLFVASTIASLGTSAIAADAILNNIGTFNNIPGSAIGMASVTIIGQCRGAGEIEQVKYYSRKLLLSAMLSMTAMATLLYFICPHLIAIYNLSQESSDLALSVTKMVLIQGALFWAPSFVVPNFLRATGDVKYTMYVSILSMWIFRVALSKYFAINLSLGLEGVYWGMYSDWYCRMILFMLRFKSGKWKTKAIV